MKTHNRWMAALAALLLAGCSGPLAPASVNSPAKASGPTGSLWVSIPAVAPWLAAALTAAPASPSRAFLHAAKAVVQVQEAMGPDNAHLVWTDVIEPVELSVTAAGGSTTVEGPVGGIPLGRDYRVIVKIYATSTDAEPAAVGIEDGVDIWSANNRTVYVTCVPQVPAERTLDVTDDDLTETPYDSGDITLGGSAETWYAVKLKSRVQYSVDYRSTGDVTAFAFGPGGNRWGNTLTNGTGYRYGYAFDAGQTLYFGVAGTGTDGSFGIRLREEKGSLVQGSLAFPAGSVNKQYRFFLDQDNDRTNKSWRWGSGGGVRDDLQWNFWMAGVPAGTYYLWGVLEGTSPWANTNWGDASFVPGPSAGDLETPVVKVIVDGTGTVTFASSDFPWTAYTAPTP